MTNLPPINTLLSSSLNGPVADLRSRITTVSEEAVTGRFADLVGALDGRVDRALLTQKAIEDIGTQRDQLNLRATRLEITQNSLGRVQDSIGILSTNILDAVGKSDGASIRFSSQEAQFALEDIFNALNVRHGERFLFSGDATATPPFAGAETLISDIQAIAAGAVDAADFEAQIDTYFRDPAGPFQTVIYSGLATVSDPDAVTGIDSALIDSISALAVVAIADPTTAPPVVGIDSAALSQAADDLRTGLTTLTNLRADRGIVQQQLERDLIALDAEESVLTTAFNDLTARDQFEAATELQNLQATLEAAFLLTNRLSSLSLVNFLR